MSFDVFFIPCRHAGKTADMTNPFTKERVRGVEVPEPMTRVERKAVSCLLGVPAGNPHEHDITTRDGGVATVINNDGGLEGEFLKIRSLTPDLLRFLMDLLGAAHWLLFDAQSSVTVVGSEEVRRGLPKSGDQRDAVLCESPEDLGRILSPGFERWSAVRRAVADPQARPGDGPPRRKRKK